MHRRKTRTVKRQPRLPTTTTNPGHAGTVLTARRFGKTAAITRYCASQLLEAEQDETSTFNLHCISGGGFLKRRIIEEAAHIKHPQPEFEVHEWTSPISGDGAFDEWMSACDAAMRRAEEYKRSVNHRVTVV
jgi:hypothetical protein